MEDIERQSDWNKYLDEVRHLRRKLTLMRTSPQITDGMYSGLKSYAEANAIEQILVDLDWMLTNIIRNYIYAGEVFAGEV
jgi:ribosomal protein L19E